MTAEHRVDILIAGVKLAMGPRIAQPPHFGVTDEGSPYVASRHWAQPLSQKGLIHDRGGAPRLVDRMTN